MGTKQERADELIRQFRATGNEAFRLEANRLRSGGKDAQRITAERQAARISTPTSGRTQVTLDRNADPFALAQRFYGDRNLFHLILNANRSIGRFRSGMTINVPTLISQDGAPSAPNAPAGTQTNVNEPAVARADGTGSQTGPLSAITGRGAQIPPATPQPAQSVQTGPLSSITGSARGQGSLGRGLQNRLDLQSFLASGSGTRPETNIAGAVGFQPPNPGGQSLQTSNQPFFSNRPPTSSLFQQAQTPQERFGVQGATGTPSVFGTQSQGLSGVPQIDASTAPGEVGEQVGRFQSPESLDTAINTVDIRLRGAIQGFDIPPSLIAGEVVEEGGIDTDFLQEAGYTFVPQGNYWARRESEADQIAQQSLNDLSPVSGGTTSGVTTNRDVYISRAPEYTRSAIDQARINRGEPVPTISGSRPIYGGTSFNSGGGNFGSDLGGLWSWRTRF